MPNVARREQLLELLRERRLRDAAAADAEQLDLVVERRVLAVVQRADDVVRRREVFVAIELAAREADEVRRVQPRVLRVDRDEHLDDVIFRQPVEDDRRHAEVFALEAIDVRVQREQPVLAVDRAQDAFALRHLEDAHPRIVGRRLERELLVAGDDDGARNRRQVARLAALLVVLHELVDLLADDLALIRLLARRDAALEQVPVHLRRLAFARLRFAAADAALRLAVIEHFEPDELVDIAGGEGGLIELHPELLHADGGNVDHR